MAMVISSLMKEWKCGKNAVEYLLKQIFSRLSNDRIRNIFQKPQLGTLDPGVGTLHGEKLKLFIKGEFLWAILWKYLCSVHSHQHEWILGRKGRGFHFICV